MRSSPTQEKIAERERIERKTREYLANGGKITELPSGGSSVDWSKPDPARRSNWRKGYKE